MSKHLKLSGKIAFYDHNENSVEITTNKMQYAILSNAVMLIGVLALFSFKGLEWEEIESTHLMLIAILNIFTLGLGFYFFKKSRNKTSLIIDGQKRYIMKGKMGIPFNKIKGLAIETQEYEGEDDTTYSYILKVYFKDNTRLFIAKDDSKKDLKVLRSWIQEII